MGFGSPLDGDARQVALDVGREHRHAGGREALRQHLQRDRLAGAGGAGDEAVAVGEPQLDALGDEVAPLLAAADQDGAILHIVARIWECARPAVSCGMYQALRWLLTGHGVRRGDRAADE